MANFDTHFYPWERLTIAVTYMESDVLSGWLSVSYALMKCKDDLDSKQNGWILNVLSLPVEGAIH